MNFNIVWSMFRFLFHDIHKERILKQHNYFTICLQEPRKLKTKSNFRYG